LVVCVFYLSLAAYGFKHQHIDIYSMESGGYWAVADSYVRQNSSGKVTSLTVCFPKKADEDSIQLTFSDKTDPLRVKLGITEVAGLSEAVMANKPWSTFHTFEKEGKKTETSLNFRDFFINAERAGHKIALKLSENEKASFGLTLRQLHSMLVSRKVAGR
jgi:hypothetical protein